MTRCVQCGSFAINHNCHGRDGSDGDLCDVCYWRKRAEAPTVQPNSEPEALFRVNDRGRWEETDDPNGTPLYTAEQLQEKATKTVVCTAEMLKAGRDAYFEKNRAMYPKGSTYRDPVGFDDIKKMYLAMLAAAPEFKD